MIIPHSLLLELAAYYHLFQQWCDEKSGHKVPPSPKYVQYSEYNVFLPEAYIMYLSDRCRFLNFPVQMAVLGRVGGGSGGVSTFTPASSGGEGGSGGVSSNSPACCCRVAEF